MDRNLQGWLIVVSLALIASIAIQIFIMERLLALLRSSTERHGLREIVDKAFDALDALDRASKTAAQILEQIKPTVDQAASISRRQLSHADQVVGEVLTGVERINHGIGAAITAFFKKDGGTSKGNGRKVKVGPSGRGPESNERPKSSEHACGQRI